MNEQLKKRLIGATVLASLAVIFIPMLLEEEGDDAVIRQSNIPPRPAMQSSPQVIDVDQLDQLREDEQFGSSITPSEDSDVREIVMTPLGSSASTGDDTPVTTRVGLTSWMIQVGSFSNKENAERLVASLREAGYDTHLEPTQVKNQKLFRVRVGPEIERTNADEIAEAISKKFFVSARVIRYP